MDYLRINFEKMRFGAMKQTIDCLERAFQKFKIDFCLIGAFARDIWMDHLNHLPFRRTTLDIDFSIYIREANQFNELKNYLEEHEGFKKTEEPYRLLSPDETIVDLIPFGGIEKNNMVYLEGQPPMYISVFGNTQVLAHSRTVSIANTDFKICTLPGLCVLKLISGHEKDDRYEKDLGDFYYMLENYFDIAADTLYEGCYEDLIDEDYEPYLSAAKMLGRQMSPILNESALLKNSILNILDKLKQGFNDIEIDQMYKLEKEDKKILRFKLIQCLMQEINISI
jgi:predicted nucleotidyltransferase